MANTFDLNDAPHFSCTFTVSSTPTDPTTVTLDVTDPAKATTSYTYAGATLTRSSTGVFTRQITLNQRGVWSFTWTATGSVVASATGTVSVRF